MARPRLQSILLVALFLPMAGCLGDSEDQGPTTFDFLTIVGETCQGAAEDLCSLEDGVLHLSGVRLNGSLPYWTGIRVRQLTVPLVIEDAHVSGFNTALALDTACPTCDVTIRSSLLEARMAVVQVSYMEAWESPLLVEDTTLRVPIANNDTRSNGGIGMFIFNTTRPVVLRGVEFAGPGDGTPGLNGIALRGADSTELQLHDVRFKGFGTTAIGRWTELDIRDTTVDCVNSGFYDAHARHVFIDGFRISGCRMDICEDAFSMCPALVLGAVNSDSQIFKARNLTLTDNDEGLAMGLFEMVRITDFNVSYNRRGGIGVSGGDVVLQRGVVRANGGDGAGIGGREKVVVEGVRFEDNGLTAVNPYNISSRGLTISGYEGGEYVVRNSSFVGNRALGLVAGNFDTIVDAAWNWWGSPLGPSVLPEVTGQPLVPGLGDRIDKAVIAEPHLTAPP